MGLFRSANQKYKDKLAEEHLYWLVRKEIDDGIISQGLHSKALAETSGDAGRALGRYIQLRVDMLRSEQAAINEAAEYARVQTLARERDELRRQAASKRQAELDHDNLNANRLKLEERAERESARLLLVSRMNGYVKCVNRARDAAVLIVFAGFAATVGAFTIPPSAPIVTSVGLVLISALFGGIVGMFVAIGLQLRAEWRQNGRFWP